MVVGGGRSTPTLTVSQEWPPVHSLGLALPLKQRCWSWPARHSGHAALGGLVLTLPQPAGGATIHGPCKTSRAESLRFPLHLSCHLLLVASFFICGQCCLGPSHKVATGPDCCACRDRSGLAGSASFTDRPVRHEPACSSHPQPDGTRSGALFSSPTPLLPLIPLSPRWTGEQ